MNETFRELRRLARKIDGDIENLDKITASPDLLMGGYGDTVTESEPAIDRFFDEVTELRDELQADQEARTKFISNTQGDINKVKNFYEQMKQDCEGVETLLSDWGFGPPRETLSLRTDESETESSILTLEQMSDTPSPRTNYVERSTTNEFFTPTMNKATGIATPVIRSLRK